MKVLKSIDIILSKCYEVIINFIKKRLINIKKKVSLHRNTAKVAQLVERQPSKLNVASSNLVFRSKKNPSF
tara:strand:+ start:5783 stop:5995 length:213 start_codon:yes stop_codon:yes gene_type:complete